MNIFLWILVSLVGAWLLWAVGFVLLVIWMEKNPTPYISPYACIFCGLGEGEIGNEPCKHGSYHMCVSRYDKSFSRAVNWSALAETTNFDALKGLPR